jgi:hypothetical protein
MIDFLVSVLLTGLACSFVLTLAGKWRIIEWLQMHGTELISKAANCRFCLSWWTNLIYSICIGQFSVLNTFIIILFAMFAHEIGGLIFMFKSWIDKIIQKGTITE